MATTPIRVATYYMVSKEEQEPENQLGQLCNSCERWEDLKYAKWTRGVNPWRV